MGVPTARATAAGALGLLVVLAAAALLPEPAAARPRPRPYPRPFPYALSPRRYVAVPLDNVELIREVRQVPVPPPARDRRSGRHRQQVPEEAPYGEPQPQASYDHDSFAPEPDQDRGRFERQSGGGGGGGDDHEYVDYGAHTGHHGAFGWYADFPVISKGHR
ncbi:Elongation factor G [Frankliniella fusca]|uniref:Elongation factor G n=1 Tax=Frankliniella fusca TaxID=407009 RepID=A0AAE1H694_9NEOP|nr:Elongation factor G [Frankliniella fusca]